MAAAHEDPNQDALYQPIYWYVIPGRAEHVRLCFAEAGVPYSDTAFTEGGMDTLHGSISESNTGDQNNSPPLAPPILKHGDLVISQTPNILMYLGPRLGLAANGGNDIFRINALALAALDGFSNEVHNGHHPDAIDLYYEDQKKECLRRVKDWVENRLPKFLGYFERVLAGEASGAGPWLYGGVLTWADLVLFQTLDGTTHFFRKAVAAARNSGKYDRVFQHYEPVKARPRIAEYLASDRRQKYSNYGVYRYYEELISWLKNKSIQTHIVDLHGVLLLTCESFGMRTTATRVRKHEIEAPSYESKYVVDVERLWHHHGAACHPSILGSQSVHEHIHFRRIYLKLRFLT